MYSVRSISRSSSYICAQCLRQSRKYSARTIHQLASEGVGESKSKGKLPALLPACGAAELKSRRLISLYGHDASKFLQGLLTANVTSNANSGFYAAFLTGQGRVLNDVFVYPSKGSRWHEVCFGTGAVDEGYFVDVDGEQAAGLMKHLKRHKLRSKVALRLLPEGEMEVWSTWGADERWTAHFFGEGVRKEDVGLGARDLRAPGMGKRVLTADRRDVDGFGEHLGTVDEEVYKVRRYLKGVPEGQDEIVREEALPMNCNIDLMGGIDFKKGCYTGQELTIRTHHTGVVRRRVLPVALYDRNYTIPHTVAYDPAMEVPVLQHDAEIRRDDTRKRVTGKLIGSVGNVGLAMCRLEQMSDVTVSGEGSSFDPGDRFTVQGADGKEVGIKAFVPDWMRNAIKPPKIQKRIT